MLYLPHPHKRCWHCGYFKPISEFPKNRSKKDGLATECLVCNRKRVREWCAAHPDQVADGKRRWAKNNPEKRITSVLNWAQRNPAKVREIRRSQYWKAPEKYRQRSIEYQRKHRDILLPKKRRSALQWRIDNPDWYTRNAARWKAYFARRIARKRMLPDEFKPSDWNRALDYFGHRCAACGRPRGLWHTLAADHWIPLNSSDCPGTIPSNIIPLCHGDGGCNNSKRDQDPTKWLIRQFGPRKSKQILKRIQSYFASLEEKH